MVGLEYFAGCEPADAGFCQPEHAKPSQCVTKRHKSLPVKLGYIALCIAPADFKQGIEFFGTQARREVIGHPANMCSWPSHASGRAVIAPHNVRFLELLPKIETAQDNAGRNAFELHRKEFAGGTFLDPFT